MELRTPIPNAHAGIDYQPAVGWIKHVIGVDLGSAQDPTAISIIRDIMRPAPRWGQGYRQLFEPRKIEVCQCFRLKVGTDWTTVVDFLKRLKHTVDDSTLAIDTTGVGAVAASMLQERNVPYTGVHITSGDSYSEPQYGHYRVGKSYLLTALTSSLQSGELKIAAGAQDANVLKEQMNNFSVGYTAAGNMTVNARSGGHDDLILATAIGAFVAQRHKMSEITVSRLNW